jgi:dTDP-4-amino-4,6-dideoxygalactose transaminase
MIPFYSFKEIHKSVLDELIQKSESVIRSGNYVFGTEKFEEEFANYVGAKYCVAVSNGTSAIHLALLSLGVGPGDEVITVSHTFRATAAAIKYCGATPVYVDIDRETFTMDPDSLHKAITSKTKCILPVHIYGNAAPMDLINAVAAKKNIPVIEDCSQAHGTTLNNKHVGTFGNLGTFSFYPGKGLGALGDAGCVVTNDENLYKFMCKVRQWDDNDVGYNYRMANIQAEFLRIKLKNFDVVLEEKRKIADEYNKHFSYVTTKNSNHSYHIYPILVNDREKLIADVKSKLDLKIHYPVPVHRLTAYRAPYSLPVTDWVSSKQVSLPIYPGVDYERVINIVQNSISNQNGCEIILKEHSTLAVKKDRP